MASEADHDAEVYETLHPASLLFAVGAQLRALVVPAVVYLFAGQGSTLRFLILIFVLPTLIQPVLHYLSFRYRLGQTAMVVREGVLFRNERRIPYDRIHNVDMVQNPFHRLARVAVVRLETASGGKPEAVLRVLSLDSLERLRATVRTRSHAVAGSLEGNRSQQGDRETAASETTEKKLLELGPLEVLRLGLITNQGLVVVGGAVALVFQQNLVPWDEIDWQNHGWLDWAPGMVDKVESAVTAGWLFASLVAFAVIGLAMVLLYLFSILLAFLRFHGFTLVRQGDDLRTRGGLLTRVTQTTPRRRIQFLRVHQGPIHRLLGRSSIRMGTLGGGGGGATAGGSEGSSRQWLAPLIRADSKGCSSEILALLPEVLPQVLPAARPGIETSLDGSDWSAIAQRAWKRRFRRGTVLFLAFAAGLSFLSLWSLLIMVPAAPIQLFLARRYVACRHYRLTDQAIFWRAGWWRRNLSIVEFSKIQAVVWSQTPFDHRQRMARVRIDTAGQGWGSPVIEIPYLETTVARELANRLHREAAGRDFDWR